MKVKTYKHESLQEGLENIKRDLGGEALILSTRSVAVRPRFGLFKKQGWEITAAVEEQRPTSVVPDPQNGSRTNFPFPTHRVSTRRGTDGGKHPR